jgi:hypothetical protein
MVPPVNSSSFARWAKSAPESPLHPPFSPFVGQTHPTSPNVGPLSISESHSQGLISPLRLFVSLRFYPAKKTQNSASARSYQIVATACPLPIINQQSKIIDRQSPAPVSGPLSPCYHPRSPVILCALLRVHCVKTYRTMPEQIFAR